MARRYRLAAFSPVRVHVGAVCNHCHQSRRQAQGRLIPSLRRVYECEGCGNRTTSDKAIRRMARSIREWPKGVVVHWTPERGTFYTPCPRPGPARTGTRRPVPHPQERVAARVG